MSSSESIATPVRPTSPARQRVVGIEPELGRQVEGHGKPGLPGAEQDDGSARWSPRPTRTRRTGASSTDAWRSRRRGCRGCTDTRPVARPRADRSQRVEACRSGRPGLGLGHAPLRRALHLPACARARVLGCPGGRQQGQHLEVVGFAHLRRSAPRSRSRPRASRSSTRTSSGRCRRRPGRSWRSSGTTLRRALGAAGPARRIKSDKAGHATVAWVGARCSQEQDRGTTGTWRAVLLVGGKTVSTSKFSVVK